MHIESSADPVHYNLVFTGITKNAISSRSRTASNFHGVTNSTISNLRSELYVKSSYHVGNLRFQTKGGKKWRLKRRTRAK